MALPRWQPRRTYSKQEELLLGRLRRTRKLFAFLRDHRHELFDDGFQDELETMYRDTGAGKDPVPPALLAMAVLLQGYLGTSDAEAVEMTVVDLRWQMVLDRLGSDAPAFAQGTLQEFRQRLIRTDMDRRVLERTVELARRTKAFDWKKLPKTLRVAIDSSPLEGAGRVEDTINLLAHAARNVVVCAARLLEWPVEKVADAAGTPFVLESSIKKALDLEWGTSQAKTSAINALAQQLDSLDRWLRKQLANEMGTPPLKEHVETLAQIRAQDLEPDPEGGGRVRIREGVAPDRRVSIEDADMRHGRKSKSKLFNGYKRHIATDLDTSLILACSVTPANRPEEEAAQPLRDDVALQQRRLGELHCDRGYISSPVVTAVIAQGADVICKPWIARNGDLFTKTDFKTNLRTMTITCPAGEVQPLVLGSKVKFPPTSCDSCALRERCTDASFGIGRTVSIAEDEPLQKRLRGLTRTAAGRERLRERTVVEHSLAHLGRRQGRRARYRGTRNNLFDVRRAAAVQNLQTLDRTIAESAGHRRAA